MKKNLFLLAMASMAFVGCTNDEYLGTAQTGVQGGQGAAITFSGLPGNITRATQTPENSAATLKYNFSVLGTKTVGSDEKGVFVQGVYSSNTGVADANLYDVWYGTATAGSTTTNKHNWEYVGSGAQSIPGSATFTPSNAQTIKYWDYAASKYDFIAYANTFAGTGTDKIETGDITAVTTSSFKVKATPTQLAGFYIADKVTVNKSATVAPKYGSDVMFTFRAASTKVRLGIYETVPGYKVTSIKFRYYTTGTTEDTDDTNNGNAILNGKFVGNSVDELTATVSYPNSDNKAVLSFEGTDANTTFFDFGTFEIINAMGTEAHAPTWTNKDYTDVFPNTTITSMSDMTLWVDYVLTGEDNSAETITVTGAKAVVPAAYMTWHPNHKYTYLFKISDNTNGYTDPNEQGPAGLYPIVFDAVVDVTEDGETNTQGTITTVAEPTITTYQAGSVVAEGVKYKADDIDITVVKGGTKVTLSNSNLEVWTGFVGKTEADLALSGAFNNATKETAVSFNDGVARFTATAGTNYAVVYIDTNNNKKHYKLIEVPAVTP